MRANAASGRCRERPVSRHARTVAVDGLLWMGCCGWASTVWCDGLDTWTIIVVDDVCSKRTRKPEWFSPLVGESVRGSSLTDLQTCWITFFLPKLLLLRIYLLLGVQLLFRSSLFLSPLLLGGGFDLNNRWKPSSSILVFMMGRSAHRQPMGFGHSKILDSDWPTTQAAP